MADRVVKITSFWYVAEADLARAVLAAEGIPACLAGACALSWFWHWANADGGVKVLVRESDAGRARRLLAGEEDEDPSAQPARTCPHCDSSVPAAWEVCWSCGALADGTPFPWGPSQDAIQEEPREAMKTGWADVVGLFALTVLLIFVAFRGSPLVLFLWPILVWVFWLLARRGPQKVRQEKGRTDWEAEGETTRTPDDEPFGDPYTGDVVARRAWLAAVLGLLWFPPLILYALWVLGNLDPEADPLSQAGARRRQAGFVLTAVGLLIYGAVFLAMLAAVIRQVLMALNV
jgi:hypothetical protein